MSAAQEVFSTYELIEAILLHLYTADILKAQRLDKTIKSVIDRSMSIQQKSFLSPVPTEGYSEHLTSEVNIWASNYIHKNIAQSKAKWFFPSDSPRPKTCLGFDTDDQIDIARLDQVNASWQRMLIVQPPVDRLFLTARDEDNHDVGVISYPEDLSKDQRFGPVMSFLATPECTLWKTTNLSLSPFESE